MAGKPAVYIVTIREPAASFRGSLQALEGARLIRELPPGRVVVLLASPADRPRLAKLPGVEAIVEDRLEHLHPRTQT
jgi:peptidyl-tRNA hydrolase